MARKSVGNDFIKIYRPNSKNRFFYLGTVPENYIFGLEQLPPKGNILFITGGEKDVMTLAANGYNAICFGSETVNIPKELIKRLYYRFKHIVLLYDCDQTGLESSLKHQQFLAEFEVKRLVLPLSGEKKEKDITDFFILGNTKEQFNLLLIDLLDELYSETMSVLKSCEIDFKKPPPLSETLVSINNVPVGTQGNLMCITGSEGTGKSNCAGSILAGAISSNHIIDNLGIDVIVNHKNKAVLLYDTEQSEVQLYKNVGNVLRRAGKNEMPEYFKAYCLTSMARKERLQAIVQSMDMFYHKYGGIHFVVIDGIADLIRSANDEIESIAVVDELYRLAGIYKTCIISVLHYIPNGLKLRGHLGSELQRKAAAIISIELDDDPSVSVIKTLKVRDGSPLDVPMLQFTWSKELGMHTFFGHKTREEKDTRKKSELEKIAVKIFSDKKYFTYMELCEKIQQLMEVKERTAKSYIRFMREQNIIAKDETNSDFFIIKSK